MGVASASALVSLPAFALSNSSSRSMVISEAPTNDTLYSQATQRGGNSIYDSINGTQLNQNGGSTGMQQYQNNGTTRTQQYQIQRRTRTQQYQNNGTTRTQQYQNNGTTGGTQLNTGGDNTTGGQNSGGRGVRALW